ncbi:ADP-ribosylglycohydrolase family protein [Membranihabitans marinus]|uniref:ADP-ribosylglycohydrolase family protein n=1 Tax=Membranihabitans marinus TaxID=1227546 RepID=UPI001F355EED|nr:ADP-ribosylglycohydrolase family protein [Membranihabitans marinus]
MLKNFYVSLIVLVFLNQNLYAQKEFVLNETELYDKITGYWNGQLVGNYMGFPFENIYDREPLPVFVDRYYDYGDLDTIDVKMNLNDRRSFVRIMADAMGGAWSDDDTDIEFVMLHGLEKYGLDITYAEVAELRKSHVNRFIWAANANVHRLLNEGVLPPETGSKANNDFWYGLTSQLINELWGVIYPGMIDKAAHWSSWGGHITNDDWATHPTIFYGAMYSAGFFVDDIHELIKIGMRKLPKDSPFLAGIQDVLKWHKEEVDWKMCRQKIHDKYFREVDGFRIPFPIMGSTVNGLNAVMALLYGEGDFTQTMGIAISTGYDCDNQAATLGGLLGVMYGSEVIPKHFTHNLPSRGQWELPFNDTYINYSRDNLPNYNKISDIVKRIMAITEDAILENNGKIEIADGEKLYYIDSDL